MFYEDAYLFRSFFQLVGDLSELKNKKYEDVINGKEGLDHISEPDREFNDIHLNDLEVRTFHSCKRYLRHTKSA
jgi:hypothetical protein